MKWGTTELPSAVCRSPHGNLPWSRGLELRTPPSWEEKLVAQDGYKVIKRSDKEVGKDIHKESDEEEGVKMN